MDGQLTRDLARIWISADILYHFPFMELLQRSEI